MSLGSVTAVGAQSFSNHGVTGTIEPIVGFEHDHSDEPTPHARFMLIYGARVVAGYRLISGELEYTTGQISETFLNPPLTEKEERQNVKLGARTKLRLSSWSDLLVRAGGQASKKSIEKATLTSKTTETFPIEYHPYVGLGLEAGLTRLFSLSADVVYVIRNISNYRENDLQTTLSLVLKFSAK